MFILLTGKFPYGTDDTQTDYEMITTADRAYTQDIIYKRLSPEAKEIMKQMLTKDPKKRVSAKEALKHKWFEIADKIEVDE